LECYEIVVHNMVSRALLVTDNDKSHKDELKVMLERPLNDQHVDPLIVPAGRGEPGCRKL